LNWQHLWNARQSAIFAWLCHGSAVDIGFHGIVRVEPSHAAESTEAPGIFQVATTMGKLARKPSRSGAKVTVRAARSSTLSAH